MAHRKIRERYTGQIKCVLLPIVREKNQWKNFSRSLQSFMIECILDWMQEKNDWMHSWSFTDHLRKL